MKIIGILISVFITFFGFSQISYDFSIPLPPNEKEVSVVSITHFGTFSSEETNSFYEFDNKGIWIISTIYNSISKETVRENSKYTVKDGYIYGVAKDSIPCVLEEDRYHFGIQNKDQLIGPNSKNVLKKLDENKYILNFEENGHFVPTLLIFKGKSLTVQQFDYESGTEVFNKFELYITVKKEKMDFITITPTIKEWKKFDFEKLLFGNAILYLSK